MEKLSPEVVMKGLRKMTGLRFLDVEFFGASKSDCSRGNQKLYKFPNSLRYLRWTHYCFSSLPKTFQANNIVALEMPHSRIVQLWEVGGKKVDLWLIDSFTLPVLVSYILLFVIKLLFFFFL